MAEYIEKYDAYKIIYDFQNEKLKNGQVLISLSELREITFHIPALPTIDIVTCSECIHAEELMTGKWCCDISSLCQRGTFFCADGERSDNNG